MTTKEFGEIFNLSSQQVAELCRSHKLCAEKIQKPDKNFPEWYIDPLSAARFLFYNPKLIPLLNEEGLNMQRVFIRTRIQCLKHADKETYTLKQAADILGLSVSELIKKGLAGDFGKRRIFFHTVSLIEILIYIKRNDQEQVLNDRYADALVNAKPTLYLLREVVIAYSYFKEYGYVF